MTSPAASTPTTEPKPKSRLGVIPVWVVVTVVMTLGLGVVLGMLAANLFGRHDISMTTASLISFVFTVALGGASVVLAIVAIFLSNQAEEALTRRNDEGIRLQTDIFTRTNEVLSTIQTSTGLTERRIEDIASGRANVIAQEVLEKSAERKKRRLSEEEFDELRQDLASSLQAEFGTLFEGSAEDLSERLDELESRQAKRNELSAHWREYKDAVIQALLVEGAELVHAGQGLYGSSSPDFWDAIVSVDGQRVGLDVHTRDQVLDEASSFHEVFGSEPGRTDFLDTLLVRAARDRIDRIAMPWDSEVDIEETLAQIDRELEGAYRPIIVHGDAQSVAAQIIESVRAPAPE